MLADVAQFAPALPGIEISEQLIRRFDSLGPPPPTLAMPVRSWIERDSPC